MKVTILGAGPAGLYCALLLKRANPHAAIRVIERNPAGATYGWGVVFSDRTLASFREADYPSYKAIADSFVIWDAIDTRYRDSIIRCGGHVIAGISRKLLLSILQDRCRELGVELRFDTDLTSLDQIEQFGEYDVLIAADGANSLVRRTYEAAFQSSIEPGRAKYVWFGTNLLLDAFTFIFRENEHGLFQVHAYPFSGETGTFIVECAEDVWLRAGLDTATEAESVSYCERLFAEDLQGARLLSNRSLWISFPTLKTAHWSKGNIVLLGDAAHTAHFSIGSGTKLAMEDAIALANALSQYSTDIAQALAEYELERKPVVETLQAAAHESRVYFETLSRYLALPPVPFTFQLLTRSGRVTYDDLRLRDPGFGKLVDQQFASYLPADLDDGLPEPYLHAVPPPAFSSVDVGPIRLPNHLSLLPEFFGAVTRPADDPDDLGAAVATPVDQGGAGLLMTPPMAVSWDGRSTPETLGMYRSGLGDPWRQTIDICHEASRAKLCAVLSHAGRRGAVQPEWAALPDTPLRENAWPLLAPSPIPYTKRSQVPREMTREDMDRVRDEFVVAARRADDAGFDLLLLHMAHGYLLASFLSPLTNKRRDDYGGSFENRLRFPLEVFAAVRDVWPREKPLGVVLNADDCISGGLTVEDAIAIARELKAHGCELIQPLAGQTVPEGTPVYGRGFLTRYSDRIRNEACVATLVGGYLTTMDQINTVIAGGRADVCILTPTR